MRSRGNPGKGGQIRLARFSVWNRLLAGNAPTRDPPASAAGGGEFFLGNSDRLPFDDKSFDKVFTVHTVYFWKTPLDHLAEARRVLKPGGRFVLGFRPAEDAGFQATFPSEIYHIRPEAEVAQLARDVGFEAVELRRHKRGALQISFVIGARAQNQPA
jgi:SAM-dependent methyltransferase